ncbi:Transposase [Aneurinibacillus thermoaerophilus]|uniref:Transposase n=1 Tax=Aneurinibacillus thermoaerophilus TaxID=143495 RepID=A0A1G8F4F5_ANETH|nr:transposase [Aneurinibacillus thermoaerophilus]SDH77014.1 Transposase [Aneurinibacillus thermoaerophilus]
MAKGKWQEWVTPEGLTLLEGWARDGLTDEQIAKNIGISTSTLYEWKKKYSEISEALKKGKEVIDLEVENALLKRALGYRYDEVTKERCAIRDENGEIVGYEMVVTKVTTKEVQPDVTAQIFWLKNRQSDKWRDKQNIEHSGQINQKMDMSGLSVEELRRLAKLDQ